jgi:DNA polymerase I-like protein with 3'-5' exonuclease and polymerase domains
LIKPVEGYGAAYLDWSGQEVAIAAARSGDKLLWHAYDSGDPYLAFAIQAGLAPSDATKETHRATRDRCKVVVLGVQYGMSAHGVAQQAGISLAEARALLQRHRETYRRFWEWSDCVVNQALLGATLTTPFGWRFRLGTSIEPNPRSLMNFPMQSGGADMMRLACAMGVEAGLTIFERLDDNIDRLSTTMRDASELVLGEGRRCRVDVKVVRFPDRYMDEAGEQMWSRVMALLAKRRSG